MAQTRNLGFGVARRAASTPTQARRDALIERFLSAAADDDDVGAIRDVLRAAMRDASQPSRVALEPGSTRWTYQSVPDHHVRTIAARILAELCGIVGSGRDALAVTVNGDVVSVSVDQRVVELEGLGVPREVLIAELRQVVDEAEAAQPPAPVSHGPVQSA